MGLYADIISMTIVVIFHLSGTFITSYIPKNQARVFISAPFCSFKYCMTGTKRSDNFFSSPKLKAQDELLWSLSVCRPSVCPSIPLNDFSSESPGPNFYKLHVEPFVKRDWKFVQMVTVREVRWPPCPYLVKTLKNLLFQNQESFEAESWYIAFGTPGLPILFKWWP